MQLDANGLPVLEANGLQAFVPDEVRMDENANAGQLLFPLHVETIRGDLENTFPGVPIEIVEYSPNVLTAQKTEELQIAWMEKEANPEDEEKQKAYSELVAQKIDALGDSDNKNPRGKVLLQYRPAHDCKDNASWRIWVEGRGLQGRQMEWDPLPGQVFQPPGPQKRQDTCDTESDRPGEAPSTEPDIIPTNPEHLPKPECDSDGASFASADVEKHLYDFCSDDSIWDTTIVPFISTGNRKTSDGQPKSAGVSRGFYMTGSDEKLWVGIMFSRDSCKGSFTVGVGLSAQEKLDHCWERFRAVLHGCQTDTTTTKTGGQLKDVCAVYGLKMSQDNPFDEPRWYSDLGEMQCEDDSEGGNSDACTCWYSGYPDLTDTFKRPDSGQCNGNEVELEDLLGE